MIMNAEQAAQLKAARAAADTIEAAVKTLGTAGGNTSLVAQDIAQDVGQVRQGLDAMALAIAAIPDPVPTPTPTPDPAPAPTGLVWDASRSANGATISADGASVSMAANRWARAATVAAPVGIVGRFTLRLDAYSSPDLWAGIASTKHDWNATTQWGNAGYVGGTAFSIGYNAKTGEIRKERSPLVGAVKKPAKVGSVLEIELTAKKTAILSLDGVKLIEADISAWPDVALAIGSESGSLTASVGVAGAVTPAPAPTPAPSPAPSPTPAPAPTPSPSLPTGTLGVALNNGNSAAEFDKFVQMMGGKLPAWNWANCDDSSQKAWIDSLNGQIGGGYGAMKYAASKGVRPWYTIPIVTKFPGYSGGRGHYWSRVIAGEMDATWEAGARSLAAAYGKGGPIIVRPASEPNGNWFVYGVAKGEEAAFVECWQRYVGVFEKVGQELGVTFWFDYNPQPGWDEGGDALKMYPGKRYTHIVSGDFYSLARYTADPVAEFNRYLNHRYGLKWIRDFGASEGLRTAYPEWGVDTDSAAFINLAADHFASDKSLLMQCYWMNGNDGGASTNLMDGSKPQARAAYIQRFAA